MPSAAETMLYSHRDFLTKNRQYSIRMFTLHWAGKEPELLLRQALDPNDLRRAPGDWYLPKANLTDEAGSFRHLLATKLGAYLRGNGQLHFEIVNVESQISSNKHRFDVVVKVGSNAHTRPCTHRQAGRVLHSWLFLIKSKISSIEWAVTEPVLRRAKRGCFRQGVCWDLEERAKQPQNI